ncbi:TIR domain-containing protein [Shimia sp. R9_3]|uniref:TIR domain-containing protein n=1 Tax=Shimia sp. R9_3 TaxID=2821113 RepID=UPI001ADBDE9A|nr:TIR domain-containing protein [Shimia sp. R9_3]MBO9400523.1 TIR domain-containing protein [Shimia sp. R9_3]
MAIFRWIIGFPQRVVNALFGYDFFISYAHKDGVGYPQALDRALSKDFTTHLDTRDYRLGQDLGLLTKIRIRNSKHLIVVARPHALTKSIWVRREVETFQNKGKAPIIVDVDRAVKRALDQPVSGALSAWIKAQQIVHDDGSVIDPLLWVSDDGEVNERNERVPAPKVIERIRASFTGAKVETMRLRVVTVAFLSMMLLATLSAFFAYNFDVQRKTAIERSSELAASSALYLVDNDFVAEAWELAKDALPADAEGSDPHDPLAITAGIAVLNASSKGTSDKMTDHILDADFNATGELVVTGHQDGHVRIWNVRTGSLLHQRSVHGDSAFSVEFSPKAKVVLSGGFEKTLFAWNYVENTVEEVVQIDGNVTEIEAAAAAARIAFLSSRGQIRVWDFDSNSVVGEPISGHENYHDNSFAIDPGGTRVALKRREAIVIYDVRENRELCSMPIGEKKVKSLYFDPSGNHIAARISIGELKVDQQVYAAEIEAEGECSDMTMVDQDPSRRDGLCGLGAVDKEGLAWVPGTSWFISLTKEKYRVEKLVCATLVDWTTSEVLQVSQILRNNAWDEEITSEINKLVVSNPIASQNLDLFAYPRSYPGGEFIRNSWMRMNPEELGAGGSTDKKWVAVASNTGADTSAMVSDTILRVVHDQTGDMVEVPLQKPLGGFLEPQVAIDPNGNYIAVAAGEWVQLYAISPLRHVDTVTIPKGGDVVPIIGAALQSEPFRLSVLHGRTKITSFALDRAGTSLVQDVDGFEVRRPVQAISPGPDGRLWAVGMGGSFLIIDPASASVEIVGELQVGDARQKRLYEISSSADGKTVAAAGSELGVFLHHKRGPHASCPRVHVGKPEGLHLTYDGRFLLVQEGQHGVLLFDLATCRSIGNWQFSYVSGVSFGASEAEIQVLSNGVITSLLLPTHLGPDGLAARLRKALAN